MNYHILLLITIYINIKYIYKTYVLIMIYSYLLHKLIDFSGIFLYFIHYFALNSLKIDPVICDTVDFSTFRIIILNNIHDVL